MLISMFCAGPSWASDPLPAFFEPLDDIASADGPLATTTLPDGRIWVAGAWAAQTFSPVTKTWSPMVPSLSPHIQATAVCLPDGRVLLAGTISSTGASAEIYSENPARFSLTGAMKIPRYGALSILLGTGEVLMVGGRRPGSNTSGIREAELFNPTTGQWRFTGTAVAAHLDGTATLLSDGRVLLLGGFDNGLITSIAEVYTPQTGQFHRISDMTITRSQQASIRLNDGRVLVSGGWTNQLGSLRIIEKTEIFNPVTETFTASANMTWFRMGHSLMMLPDGRVLVVGGQDDFGATLNSSEVFDPVTVSFLSLSARMVHPRRYLSSIALPEGRAIMVGGQEDGVYLESSEMFIPDEVFRSNFD